MTKEEKKIYDRQRYLNKIKPKIFRDRKCLCCEILLKGKFGANNSKLYCGGCIKNGSARKDQNRRAYKRNRKKILEQVKKYHQENRDYRLAYYRRWEEKCRQKEERRERGMIVSEHYGSS